MSFSVRRVFAAFVLFFALAATLAPTATASIFVIDDFSVGQGPLTASGSTGPVAIGGGITRNLTLVSLGGLNPVQHNVEVSFGRLDITNGSGDDSRVRVDYTLPQIIAPGMGSNIELQLLIFLSDGNQSRVNVGGIGTGMAQIAPNSNMVWEFLPQAGSGFGPGNLSLTFNGRPGWDLALDNFQLEYNQVPEPGTMGLAAVGAGLALFGRRRILKR